MSLGDFGPRGRRIWLSLVIGVTGMPIFTDDRVIGGAIVALALASVAYQAGRVVENDKMKERKWYSEET